MPLDRPHNFPSPIAIDLVVREAPHVENGFDSFGPEKVLVAIGTSRGPDGDLRKVDGFRTDSRGWRRSALEIKIRNNTK